MKCLTYHSILLWFYFEWWEHFVVCYFMPICPHVSNSWCQWSWAIRTIVGFDWEGYIYLIHCSDVNTGKAAILMRVSKIFIQMELFSSCFSNVVHWLWSVSAANQSWNVYNHVLDVSWSNNVCCIHWYSNIYSSISQCFETIVCWKICFCKALYDISKDSNWVT